MRRPGDRRTPSEPRSLARSNEFPKVGRSVNRAESQ
jgi:hypothetical protein